MSSPPPSKAARVDGAADSPALESVTVALGDGRSYPIVFAPVGELARALEAAGVRGTKRAALVSNTVVGALKHRADAERSLRDAGWDVTYVEIPDG